MIAPPWNIKVIEGRAEAVDETYARISRDRRHRDLVVIEHSPILRRSFGDWTMGFRRCDDGDPTALPGYSNILEYGFRANELIQNPNFAKEILQELTRGVALR